MIERPFNLCAKKLNDGSKRSSLEVSLDFVSITPADSHEVEGLLNGRLEGVPVGEELGCVGPQAEEQVHGRLGPLQTVVAAHQEPLDQVVVCNGQVKAIVVKGQGSTTDHSHSPFWWK